MEKLNNLAKQITSLKHDIRAEVLINNLLKNDDIRESQYIISKEGQFSRAYRFDVLDADVVDYDLDSTHLLKLELSRDSFYDMLPENLTHTPRNDSPEKDADRMVKEYQIQKSNRRRQELFSSLLRMKYSVMV
ncbi:hypothetical protein [Chryseobacterium indoltheticum]|uniref:hypothetical protein n=1 Tax=Chryseobacterium indoltheticum TaxID=254 RepID=UPI003F491E13